MPVEGFKVKFNRDVQLGARDRAQATSFDQHDLQKFQRKYKAAGSERVQTRGKMPARMMERMLRTDLKLDKRELNSSL